MKCDKKGLLLYAVTDRSWLNGETLYSQVEKALQGGATFIQLREKNLDQDHFMEEALELKKLCAAYHVPFVINDNVEIAAKMDADGVHVGQGDMPVAEVRRRYPSLRIVGLSTHNPDQARAAIGQKPDYIGVGPVFATPTKKIPDPTLGVETAAQMIASVPFPAVAIGGLNRETLPSVLAAGARNFAVVRAVCGAADPEAAIRAIQQLSRA